MCLTINALSYMIYFMKYTYQKPLLQKLDMRRRELGLSRAALAHASGVSLPTVNRILSGQHSQASWSNILSIARTLGLNVEFKPVAEVQQVREHQAQIKAEQLIQMVQSTSALEGQAMDAASLEQMKSKTIHELLAGSNRTLWAE